MFVTASQEKDFWCSVSGHHQGDGDLIMNMATQSQHFKCNYAYDTISYVVKFHDVWLQTPRIYSYFCLVKSCFLCDDTSSSLIISWNWNLL